MAKQSITNFKSNISSIGFARSNIFEATINPPGTTNAKTSPTNHKFYKLRLNGFLISKCKAKIKAAFKFES